VINGSVDEDLPRATHRHLPRRAAVAPTHSAAALSTVHFTLRLDRGSSDLNCLGCLAGLSALVAGNHSPYPQLTAITTSAISIPPLVLSFAALAHLTQRIAARTEPGGLAPPFTSSGICCRSAWRPSAPRDQHDRGALITKHRTG